MRPGGTQYGHGLQTRRSHTALHLLLPPRRPFRCPKLLTWLLTAGSSGPRRALKRAALALGLAEHYREL